MKQFYKKVDLRSKKAMIEFLSGHSRYSTMSSWNCVTSYSNNIKLYNLELDREIENKLYDLIQTDEFYDELRVLFDDFAMKFNYQWQVGTNGRSSGYLVLYKGEQRPSGYKSFCEKCGQKNFTSVSENKNICGMCGSPSRVGYASTHMQVIKFLGQDVDQGENFSDWSIYDLQERVKLIQHFDKLTDEIVALAYNLVENCVIEEETYYIPHTRKVLVSADASA